MCGGLECNHAYGHIQVSGVSLRIAVSVVIVDVVTVRVASASFISARFVQCDRNYSMVLVHCERQS